MNTYTELSEKMQGEFLESLKQAQELSLKTLSAFGELIAQIPTAKADAVTLPTPAEAVEQGYAFANRLLEARKEYTLKLAELATQAQTQFAESVSRISQSAKN